MHSFSKKSIYHSQLSKTIIQKDDWKLDYSLNSTFSKNQNYSKINEEENLGTQQSISFTNNINLGFKQRFIITPLYQFNLYNFDYKFPSENFKNINNYAHSVGAAVLIDHIKKVKIESRYNLVNQVADLNNNRKNIHLINVSCFYPVMKKGELKLSVFDLLNQSINYSCRSFENNITFNQSLMLRQYFMRSMVYKFLDTGKK